MSYCPAGSCSRKASSSSPLICSRLSISRFFKIGIFYLLQNLTIHYLKSGGFSSLIKKYAELHQTEYQQKTGGNSQKYRTLKYRPVHRVAQIEKVVRRGVAEISLLEHDILHSARTDEAARPFGKKLRDERGESNGKDYSRNRTEKNRINECFQDLRVYFYPVAFFSGLIFFKFPLSEHKSKILLRKLSLIRRVRLLRFLSAGCLRARRK